jgi:hypothetical protein
MPINDDGLLDDRGSLNDDLAEQGLPVNDHRLTDYGGRVIEIAFFEVIEVRR